MCYQIFQHFTENIHQRLSRFPFFALFDLMPTFYLISFDALFTIITSNIAVK